MTMAGQQALALTVTMICTAASTRAVLLRMIIAISTPGVGRRLTGGGWLILASREYVLKYGSVCAAILTLMRFSFHCGTAAIK